MNRKIEIAMLALPVGMIALLAKPASATETMFSSSLNQSSEIVAQRYDDRWDDRRDNDWRDDDRRDYRRDNDWRDGDRRDRDRRELRRDAIRRQIIRRDGDRRDEQTRRVWIPGHWESGFLGIGRKWVEGRWETRN